MCDLFGIDLPIFAFSHCRDVVAEVSRAGGFGVLGVTALTPEQLEVELAWIEERVGDKPYGVDVLVPAKFVGRDRGGLDGAEIRDLIPDAHREFVRSLMSKYGVPPLPADDGPAGGGRAGAVRGWNLAYETVAPLLDVALAHRVSVVANALGPPPPELVERAHSQGVLVAALAGTPVHALRHKAMGVDLIVAQGGEAGGHTGEVATMVLVPEVVDAVAPLPVLAAGGIATGRQIAAALALGAEGVWCGSVWLTTEEAETHPVVKEKFLAAGSSDTVRSRAKTGKPARQLRSAWTDEWADPANPDPLPMPLQPMLVGQAEQRIARAAHVNPGARALVNYFVGQVVGQMNDVKPVRQVIVDMVDEYLAAADRLSATLDG